VVTRCDQMLNYVVRCHGSECELWHFLLRNWISSGCMLLRTKKKKSTYCATNSG